MKALASCVDWDELRSNCGEDEELLKELVQIFLSESPQMLEDIRRSWLTADALALKQTAHRLKGSLVSLAANSAAQCAQFLEQLGYEAKLEGAGEGVAELERRMSALHAELKQAV
ncbi:MAG: Hpt domain-containing protein [Cystobacterineae bacterium]|nr:Hpt domain-containing protein [Cystobacterineae bacterium]